MNEQDEFDQDIIQTNEPNTPGQILDQAQHTQALQRFGGQLPQHTPGTMRDFLAYRDCRRAGKPEKEDVPRTGFVLKACGGMRGASRWKHGLTRWGDA